jgi:hypothetical protein
MTDLSTIVAGFAVAMVAALWLRDTPRPRW